MVADHLREGDAESLHRPLIVGVHRQVIVHDVAIGHAEEQRVAEPANRLAHIGNGLGVKELHLLGVAGLRIGEYQEGVLLVGIPERHQVEACRHLAVRCRTDGLEEPEGSGLLRGDLESGWRHERNEGTVPSLTSSKLPSVAVDTTWMPSLMPARGTPRPAASTRPRIRTGAADPGLARDQGR